MAKTVLERFEANVMADPNSGCWLWTGHIKSVIGYGWFYYKKGGTRLAHRVAYELYIGPIPSGLDLDHKCRVRSCVNPYHLEPVTRGENVRRGINGLTRAGLFMQKTHCRKGHELTPETSKVKQFTRQRTIRCLICTRASGARYDAKRRPRKLPC